MKTFEFDTTCTMKEYNRKFWWIDSGYVRRITIEAENLKSAILQYRDILKEKYFINVSDNAIKNKNPMYIDRKDNSPLQIGYVFTGQSDFQRENGTWSSQFIDLWTAIKQVQDVDFLEVESC